MDSPFSFSDTPDAYLDFLQMKRREMFALVVGATSFGAGAAGLVAAACGDATAAIPAVQAMGVLFAGTTVGLVAYGLTQGGTQRGL
mmetsp:Transcript_78329/g.155172  ORF Transcript_78329/g.155172 Transcript_78329/m.155172 type:complete len:86 (-) Transcript_78329:395-652(-)